MTYNNNFILYYQFYIKNKKTIWSNILGISILYFILNIITFIVCRYLFLHFYTNHKKQISEDCERRYTVVSSE